MSMDGQGMDPGAGAPDASEGMDLDSLLGTSPEGDPTGGLQAGLPGQGAETGAGASQPFKFAGRTFAGGQKEAEGAWNKIYGGYSERQGLVNALKKADPQTLAALSNDPKIGPILEKLGIQAAQEQFEADERGGESGQMSMEDLRMEIAIDRHQNSLLREEMAFERKLGRQMSDREHDAVMEMIARAESLTYEEAYYLAHRQQIMKQTATQNAAAQGAPGASQGGRPKPPPRSMPGTPNTGKKSMADMSEEEWKRNLKESGLIKEFLSKGR